MTSIVSEARMMTDNLIVDLTTDICYQRTFWVIIYKSIGTSHKSKYRNRSSIVDDTACDMIYHMNRVINADKHHHMTRRMRKVSVYHHIDQIIFCTKYYTIFGDRSSISSTKQ